MVVKAVILPEEGAPESPSQTEWHVLLGGIQEPLLVPVEVAVEAEPLASQKPPRLDLLLLRRKGNFWTPAQQARLPDGIRQSSANHILCEFKYTQSVNENALLQARLHDYLYLTSRRLKRRAVQTFLVSSRTPQAATLTTFGYEPTAYPGVYHSQDKWLKVIDLLVLNELSNEPHNAFFKCFASRKQEREAAFATIERMAIWNWSEELWTTVNGLHAVFQRLEGGAMKKTTLTPEYLRELGEGMRKQIIATVSPKDISEGMRKQIIATLSPKEISEDVREQIIATVSPKEISEDVREQIIATVSPKEISEDVREQIIAALSPKDILAHISPEQLLAELDPNLVEAYLQKQKESTASKRRKTRKAQTARA